MQFKLKIYILILSIFTITEVSSQGQQESNDSSPVGNILPPSPTASGLGQYAEIPVSEYTGTPSISVPLYEASVEGVSLPISLSYHASGNKVETIASWVGLGWSLNAGGNISRVVKGVPDDAKSVTSLSNGVFNGINAGYLYNSQFCQDLYDNNPDDYTYDQLDYASSNLKDSSPDEFYFNFNGYSGKFIFDKDGEAKIFSNQDLKIAYTLYEGIITPTEGYLTSGFNLFPKMRGGITSFTITTPDGVKYVFENPEVTFSSNNSAGNSTNFSDCNPPILFPYMKGTNCGADPRFSENIGYSSWNLSRIYSPNDKLNTSPLFEFTYEKDFILDHSTINYLDGAGCGNAKNPLIVNLVQTLSSIRWAYGEVKFRATRDRNDLYYPTINGGVVSSEKSRALSRIDINYSWPRVTLKSFEFSYGDFNKTSLSGCSNNADWLEKHRNRLKLLTVTESGGGLSLPPYTFTYDETPLPPRHSIQKDFWGFYNGKNQTSPYPTLYSYPDDNLTNNGTNGYCSIYPKETYTGEEVTYEGGDRNPDFNFMKAGILTKINYPTGGSSEFEYENHQFKFESFLNYGSSTKNAGGLRVKKVITSAGSGGNDIVSNYQYVEDGTSISSGNIISLPQFAYRFNWLANLVVSDAPTNLVYLPAADYSGIRKHSNSQGGLGSTHGSVIGYKEVIKQETGNGRTVKKFDIRAPYGHGQYDYMPGTQEYLFQEAVIDWGGTTLPLPGNNFPFTQNSNYDWNRGQLLEELIYDNAGVLKKQTLNTYTIRNYEKIKATNPFVWKTPANVTLLNVPSLQHAAYFPFRFCGKYNYISGFKYLSNSAITEFFDDGTSMATSTDYTYTNDHTNPIEISTSNGGGQKTVINKYAHDISSSDGISMTVIQEMKNRNMVGIPIISETSGSVRSGTKTKFRFFSPSSGTLGASGMILPHQIEVIKGSSGYRLLGTILKYTPDQKIAEYLQANYSASTQKQIFTWNNGLLMNKNFNGWNNSFTYHPYTRLVKSVTGIDGQVSYYDFDGLLRLKKSRKRGNNVMTDFTYQIGGGNNSVTSTTSFTDGTPAQTSKQEYDGLGRSTKTISNGIIKESISYDEYGRVAAKMYLPGSFVTLDYEPSPLDKQIKQTFPDGTDIEMFYGTDGGQYAVKTTDENDNTSTTVSDILGRNSRMIDAKGSITTYSYNPYGKIGRVTPPNFATTNEDYFYTYDNLNRLIEKEIPGGGTHEFRYNTRDQMVASKTGNEWIGTIYDSYNRPTKTGILGGVPSVPNHITISDLLTESFYDNSSLLPAGFLDISESCNNARAKGKLVGMKVKVLETDDWLYTTTCYDQYGRSFASNSTNQLDGNDEVISVLNLADLVEKSTRTHNTTIDNELINQEIVEDFTYDNFLRQRTHRHDIIGLDPTLLSLTVFNNSDQLTNKKIGKATGVNGYLQNIDYQYNDRGWLTHINEVDMVGQEVSIPECNNDPIPTECGEKCDFSVSFAARSYSSIININYGQLDPSTGSYNTMTADLNYPYRPDYNGNFVQLENDLIAWMFAEGIPSQGVEITSDNDMYTLTIYGTDAKFQALTIYEKGFQNYTFTSSCIKDPEPELCDFAVDYSIFEKTLFTEIILNGETIKFEKPYGYSYRELDRLREDLKVLFAGRKIRYRDIVADAKNRRISIYQTDASFDFLLDNYKRKFPFVKSNCTGGDETPTTEVNPFAECKEKGYELDRCPDVKVTETCTKCDGGISETCESCQFKAKFIRPTSIKVEYNHPALLKGDLSSKANLLRVTESSYRTLNNDQVLFTHKTQNTAIGEGLVANNSLTHVMEIQLDNQWITDVTLETVKGNIRKLLTAKLTNAGIKAPEMQAAFANAVVDVAANDWAGTTASLGDDSGGPGQGPSSPTISNPDMFSMQLLYADGHDMVNSAIQKNGNISGMVWKTPGRNTQSYSFEYDEINRLTDAYHQDVTGAGQLSTNNKYGIEVTYDKVGNINTMNRRGVIDICNTGFEYGPMDALAYNYNSGGKATNRLQSIEEFANTEHGFKTKGGGYSYDGFGNMTADPKSGAAIQYNHLNLPKIVTFAQGSIEFTYDAAGIKLKKEVSGSGEDAYTLYYIGGIEYRDDQLESIHHAEGRITFQENKGTGEDEPLYEYFLKDHLGNIRVTIADKDGDGYIEPFNINPTQPNSGDGVPIDLTDTEIYQETHYYPFGMAMEGEWEDIVHGAENQYLYNRKELNSDFGLDWIDYGARFYDAAIGKWNAVDPLAENHYSMSSFNYVLNNPILLIDPDGRDTSFADNATKKEFNDTYQRIDNKISSIDNKISKAKRDKKKARLVKKKGKLTEIKKSFDDVINSKTMFHFTMLPNPDGLITGGGGTTFNFDANRLETTFVVDVTLVHEVRHGAGYERGEWGMNSKKEYEAYDYQDEYEGYKQGSDYERLIWNGRGKSDTEIRNTIIRGYGGKDYIIKKFEQVKLKK